MRTNILTIIAVASLLILIGSCGQNIGDKLTGTWKVSDVKTDFNENKVSPETLRQVVEMQKQTYFRIVNDSVLIIISNKNTHETKWVFDDEDQTITYFFKGSGSRANVLGKYENGNIVNQSKTAFGNMTITYSKE
jgi:hypothetical protein